MGIFVHKLHKNECSVKIIPLINETLIDGLKCSLGSEESRKDCVSIEGSVAGTRSVIVTAQRPVWFPRSLPSAPISCMTANLSVWMKETLDLPNRVFLIME